MKLTMLDSLPTPMAEAPPENSDIWQKEITFEKGNRYLIVGESGCGKTTFFHMLCGMRRDYQGQILVDGRDISSFTSFDWGHLRAERLGLLFQDLRLFSHLTPRENLALLPRHEKNGPSIREMAEKLGMVPYLDRPCGKLSQGQRQRVALMRVLFRPFEFLLLDEPFSHLDEANMQAMTELIQEEIERRAAGLILASLGDKNPFSDLRRLQFVIR